MSESSVSSPVTLNYKRITALSLPVILANITLPIQGLIDVAIIGHLESADYLSAVGLAAQLFSLLFVSFNFLQYASSGLSAQALGQSDMGRLQRVLLRALLLSFLIGVVLIVLQSIWWRLGLWFFDPPERIANLLHDYYAVRIWSAPFELANYAFIGWFAGQSRPQLLLRQQLLISLSNVVFNLFFVLWLDMDVVGVALGTLLASALGAVYAFYLANGLLSERGQRLLRIDWQRLKQRAELFKLLQLNRDIWIRTSLLTLCFAWVTRLSTQQGELILAANVLLLQLLTLAAFAIDGIAITTESLVGQAFGRNDKTQLKLVVRMTTHSALVMALLLSIIFWLIKPLYLSMMTDITAVTELAERYYGFAALIPLVTVMAYQLDGVMFGMTANRVIRNSMVLLAIVFFPISPIFPYLFDNTGVWMALYVFFILRGLILAWQFKRLQATL